MPSKSFPLLLSLVSGATADVFLAARQLQAEVTGQCSFAVAPDVGYYWDPSCSLSTPGCWADSAHVQCRFCGAPYNISCPELPATIEVPSEPLDIAGGVAVNESAGAMLALRTDFGTARQCSFENQPLTRYYWEPQCRMGVIGCMADGLHPQCRFCGSGAYADIACPEAECVFPNEPRTPYYWDPSCAMGEVGCLADGIHVECRFCVKRPFDHIHCPAMMPEDPSTAPVAGCAFASGALGVPHYWDPSCTFGKLGCWADGINAECRFCGWGAYEDVPCP